MAALQQIAQVAVPADGIGNPQWVLIDWARSSLFFVGVNGRRRYSVELATQSPAVSVAQSSTVLGAAIDPVSGCLIMQQGIPTVQNGDPIYKYDPTSLTLLATYGVGTAAPNYPASFWGGQGIACVACGSLGNPSALVGYAFLKETAFQPYVDAFRVSDTFTAAGFRAAVVSGATNNRALMCAGASGGTGGSVFLTWQGQVNGPKPTLPLYKVTVSPGAETYDISSWPTPNPHIASSTVGTIAAASIDATWTNLAAYSIGYDKSDGNVLLSVSTSDAVTTKHYLVKVNSSSAAVIWAVPILPNTAAAASTSLAGSSVNGTLGWLGTVNNQVVTTSSGATTTDALGGLLFNLTISNTIEQVSSLAADTGALFFADIASYNGAASNAPQPVAGTPSSFSTGYAFIGGSTPPPAETTIEVGDLWYAPTGDTFIDLRASDNRRLFIGVDGSTPWLGDDGSRPLGSAPPIFLTLSQGEAANDWPQNRGTGGVFTRVGTDLAIASGIPPCSDYELPITVDPNTPQGADPQIRLAVSDDGGRTFSLLQKWRSMGKIGQYRKRLRWMKMGMFRQRQIRLEVTDPVRRNIIGIYLDTSEGLDW